MTRETDIDAWLKSGEYLPECLRDFHDQKDLFKAMHQIINVQGHEYAKPVGWVEGQCYVIDIFLWFMARRGYQLQRTHRRGNFRSLEADVKEAKAQRGAHFFGLLKQGIQPAGRSLPPAPTPPSHEPGAMMDREQFIAAYCEASESGSVVTREWILANFVALPCACGDESCKGWAMIHNTPEMIALHSELYAPDREAFKA